MPTRVVQSYDDGFWFLEMDTIEAFYVCVVLFTNDGSIKELESFYGVDAA